MLPFLEDRFITVRMNPGQWKYTLLRVPVCSSALADELTIKATSSQRQSGGDLTHTIER
jgi:hypothetical protein